ncbi:response regulator [Nostoc parmelioides]|uniref:Response regulator n=1 Tax=Nostoc parmelioides FACHB-3921 TaxID=2692909 RepID=A0ABR8BGG8_9NOSO|nr:response regulator [Nostoc parmelioides]MBD2252916.1 response regulator [Nostoc parmelioides FACHB-3921]
MDRRSLILIVEENLHNLELLNSHLKTLNYDCICAKQGVSAIILAQTQKPDLIILDMILSDLSGSQVINHLKQDSKTANIPIIAVIPFILVQNQDHLFLTGADDYVTKPYNFVQLNTLITHYVTRLHSSNLLSE